MTEQSDSLTAGVVEWLNSSGVTVELFTARTFMGHGLGVIQGKYLPDPESPGTPREIDVVASREVRIPDTGTMGVYLVVECKYTAKPWVIVRGRPDYESAIPDFSRITTALGQTWLERAARSHPAINGGHTFQQEARPGHALLTAHVSEDARGDNPSRTGKNNQDLAYAAIMAATKHARAWADELSSRPSLPFFGVVFPAVVVRGPLYEASLVEGRMTAKPIASGQVDWDHPTVTHPVIVDIVTDTELPSFTRRFSETAEALLHHGKDAAISINSTGIY